MAKYPTKEEIMATPYPIKKELIVATLEWKAKEYSREWKYMNKEKRGMALAKLIDCLNATQKKKTNTQFSNIYCYQPSTKTIYLDRNNPSILSALHEFGHHILGANELEVCRLSVWLFKECFPIAFQKLTWKGHMLIKT
jgi:hypothetical protein